MQTLVDARHEAGQRSPNHNARRIGTARYRVAIIQWSVQTIVDAAQRRAIRRVRSRRRSAVG
jgi:hypothetical protein